MTVCRSLSCSAQDGARGGTPLNAPTDRPAGCIPDAGSQRVLQGRPIAAFFAQGIISIALSARRGVFMRRVFLSLTALFLATAAGRAEPDIHDTRLLSQPAVSARHIAFIYADDLWVADLDGKQRPPADQRRRRRIVPVFSPDGKTIAFSRQYDGNTRRLHHPGRGRPAQTADLASRRRRRPRLHARRQGGPVLLAAARLHQPLSPSFSPCP